MSLSMTSERDCAPVYRLVRWMLIALVAAGVIGMHVLSEQDTGGGHRMVMDTANHAVAIGQSMSMTGHQTRDMSSSLVAYRDAASAPSSSALMAPAHQGMSGAMAMCLLFLAASAAAIALMLLAGRLPRSRVDLAARVSGLWGVSRRGPPPSSVPRHSLCILRV